MNERALQRLPKPLGSPIVWSFAGRWLLPLWFAVWTIAKIRELIAGPGWLVGLDARIYYRAAVELVSGGNPWNARVDDFYFAAPPPTLVPYIPAILLPEDLFVVLAIIGCAVIGVALVRIFQLPWYWLFFPPLVEAVWVANPNPLVVLLLVRGLTGGAVVAVFLKLYALIPLVGELRVRAIVISVACLAVTFPFLSWDLYQAEAPRLSGILFEQARGGRSAFSVPILVPLTLLALVVLDRRTSGWLAVPALWPATQLHYSLLALPVMHPIMAVFFCIPVPGFQGVAVILYAGWVYLAGGPAEPAFWREVADRGRSLLRAARRAETDEAAQPEGVEKV